LYDKNIEINRKVAYQGRIGRLRENFCAAYIRQKQEDFAEIRREQIKEATGSSETITCHQGCSACCSLYVEAALQECEAIVYHLYQNDNLLSHFLMNYPIWRENMRRKGDLFNICQQIWDEASFLIYGEGLQMDIDEPGVDRSEETICPFLREGICSIYPVRPYVCAAFSVTTPARWCSPYYPRVPKIYRIMPERLKMSDLSFYYRPLDAPLISSMPMTIYEILTGGMGYLSTVPGLSGLNDAFRDDAEVMAVLKDEAI
ncbi:MAG: YkgJ family cysteine cluster protein, partial [Chloroflexota bacterium]